MLINHCNFFSSFVLLHIFQKKVIGGIFYYYRVFRFDNEFSVHFGENFLSETLAIL